MTSDLLLAIAGAALSLIFSYVPGLRERFASLPKEYQQLWMTGLIVAIAGAVFGLACAGVLTDLTGLIVSCDKAGALGLLRAILIAATANQVAYQLTPAAQSVRQAKAAR
jgi:hypothetical protein